MIVPKVHIRLLFVVDGYFSLGSQDLGDRSFSVSKLITTLKESSFNPDLRIDLDTAHRDGDPHATIFGKFNFVSSVRDLSDYDVIWLFGYNGANKNDPANVEFHEPLQQEEIVAITKFMASGGGVLADGDHDSLGSFLCGRLPRIRNMRKWFAEWDDQDYAKKSFPPGITAPKNWPGVGENRADTLQKDLNGDYNFTNQSDDIPQPLTLIKFDGRPHEILTLEEGKYLDVYPDHFHEGEVLGFGGVETSEPWSMTEQIEQEGVIFDEFPKDKDGNQEKPQIIAVGHVIGGHETWVEPDKLCDSGFRPTKDKTIDKDINTLSVYDGRKVGVGRIITDSSWHHFCDLNLIGDPCSSDEKTLGFNHELLTKMKLFYVNCAVWLANPRVFVRAGPTYGKGGFRLMSQE